MEITRTKKATRQEKLLQTKAKRYMNHCFLTRIGIWSNFAWMKIKVKQHFENVGLIWSFDMLEVRKIETNLGKENTLLYWYSWLVYYVSLPQKCNFTFQAIWYCSGWQPGGRAAAAPCKTECLEVVKKYIWSRLQFLS